MPTLAELRRHDTSPPTRQPARASQAVVLALLFSAGIVNFLDRGSLSVANTSIRAELHLSGAQMGALLSLFSLAYGIAQLPVGPLLDRFRARVLLGWGLLGWSAAQATTALVRSFGQFVPLRLLLGIGESPFFPASVQSVHGWFSPEERGRPIGLLNASTMLGQAIAPPLLTGLLIAHGWRAMFAVIGALGIVLSGLWFWLYRDPLPQGENPRTDPNALGAPHLAPEMWEKTLPAPSQAALLRSPVLWGMILGFSGINYTAWLYLAWLPGYLEVAHHVSLAHTGWLAALPFLMGACGMAGSGAVADALVRRGLDPLGCRRALIVGGMVVSSVFTFTVPHASTTLGAVLLVGGALFSIHIAGTAAWGVVQFAAPPGRVAGVAALQNFGSFMVASVAPLLTGWLLDRTHSFQLSLVLCAAVTLIGAAAYALLVRGPIETSASAG